MGINAVCRMYGVPKPTLNEHMKGTNIQANDETKKLGQSQELPMDTEHEIFKLGKDIFWAWEGRFKKTRFPSSGGKQYSTQI